MQEKINSKINEPKNCRTQRLSNIASLIVIACIVGATITTYRYPTNQTNQFFLGGEPLWQATSKPLIWLCSITLLLILAISFLFRNKYQIWRIGSLCMMIASLPLGIYFMLRSIFEPLGTVATLIICGLLAPLNSITERDFDKALNLCLTQNGVKLNQSYGISIYLIYAAAIISLLTLVYSIIVKIIQNRRAKIRDNLDL